MERIAIETEEDYQKLIKLLENFNVKILRPELKESIEYYKINDHYRIPPMCPRDYSAMIGTTLYWYEHRFTDHIKIINEISVENKIYEKLLISSATTTRVGKDLYFGSCQGYPDIFSSEYQEFCKVNFSQDYRCHFLKTEGHLDSSFCPVVPGLIVTISDIQSYEKTFPDWEILTLESQSWDEIKPFTKLKQKNYGKWWVPGEELNDEFTDFVEGWLSNWVGYVEETVFDVNILVIDEKNVVCNNYNKKVFDAFKRYGITPHILNFRHRYFWDGGLHCITSDLDREGTMQDYFPERGDPSEYLPYLG